MIAHPASHRKWPVPLEALSGDVILASRIRLFWRLRAGGRTIGHVRIYLFGL